MEVTHWVQGRSLGRRSAWKAEEVRRHCSQILTAETIKIWKFRTSVHRLILDQYVLPWGLSDILGDLAPSPRLASLLRLVYVTFALGDFALLNINLTTRRVLTLYFENSTSGVIVSWSGRVRSFAGHQNFSISRSSLSLGSPVPEREW